jgi:ureidoglycolate lyase
MNTLKLTPEVLTADNFQLFGEVLSTENKESISINDGFASKFPDIVKLDTKEAEGETSVHIFVAKKRQFPLQITMLENHPFFSQTFIPKNNTPFIVVVAPPSEEPVIENIKAFITDGDQGISYSRGVWHFPLISMNDNSEFIVLDRKNNIDVDTIEQCIVKSIDNIDISLELSL